MPDLPSELAPTEAGVSSASPPVISRSGSTDVKGSDNDRPRRASTTGMIPMLSLGVPPSTGPPSADLGTPTSTSLPEGKTSLKAMDNNKTRKNIPRIRTAYNGDKIDGPRSQESNDNTISKSIDESVSKPEDDEGLPKKPKRNTNLDEISNAVDTKSEEEFKKSTFSLKRTQSMGVFDQFIHPHEDIIGNPEDYPHLDAAELDLHGKKSESQNAQDSTLSKDDGNNNLVSSLMSVSTESPRGSDEDGYDSDMTSSSMSGTPDVVAPNDDSVIRPIISQHVDYLSHDWDENDISNSWKYIVLRRKDVANSARLENASWRSWAKARYNLHTVTPESVNWLKDSDVTWLYGPLYSEPRHSLDEGEPSSGSSTMSGSKARQENDAITKKPILKKRTAAELILSRPPVYAHNSFAGSTPHHHHHNHHRHAEDGPEEGNGDTEDGYYIRQHNYRSRLNKDGSSASMGEVSDNINRQYFALSPPRKSGSLVGVSSVQTSTTVSSSAASLASVPMEIISGKNARHVHFNDRVDQCISIDHDYENEQDATASDNDSYDSDSDSSDSEEEEGGLFLMVKSPSSVSLKSSAGSVKSLQTIAPIPATKLRYQLDDEETEQKEKEVFNSVAYAMSHNTLNRRPNYRTYDYNSVYTSSPAVTPVQSPQGSVQSALDSIMIDSMKASPTTQKGTSIVPQTNTEAVLGYVNNSGSGSAVNLLRDQQEPVPISDSFGSSEFVEDTSVPSSVHTVGSGVSLEEESKMFPPEGTELDKAATLNSSDHKDLSPPSKASSIQDKNRDPDQARPKSLSSSSSHSKLRVFAHSLFHGHGKKS